MARRRLPIGIQTFREIREEGCYYVDKTPFIRRLLDGGKHYLLSRPCRFGQSLFLDTLKEPISLRIRSVVRSIRFSPSSFIRSYRGIRRRTPATAGGPAAARRCLRVRVLVRRRELAGPPEMAPCFIAARSGGVGS